MPRALADAIKKGLAPDNLPEAIRQAKEFAARRPSIGWPIHSILDRIFRRWEPYESSGIPADEFERVTDTVCPRIMRILKALSERSDYDPDGDIRELVTSYDRLG